MIDARTRRNFLAYFSHHGARYLFPLIVTPFLARMLEPTAFADLVIWNACVWTSSIFIEFGFFLYAVNAVARAEGDAELDKTVSTILTAKLLLAPLGAAIYLAIACAVGLATRQPVATALGVVTVIGYGASLAWYFQGGQRGVIAALTEAAPQALQCLLVFAFIRSPDQLALAALFQTSAAVLPVCVSATFLLRERRIAFAGLRTAWVAISQASPYFIERCCFTAYSAATPLIVSILSDPRQAGYYGVGEKVNAFLTGLSIPLTQLMLPIVSRRIAANGRDWGLSIKLVGVVTGGTIVVAGGVFVAAHVGLVALFGEDYLPAVAVARWFCISAAVMAYQAALATFVIVPSGRARVLAFTAGSALLASLSVQALLVPQFGAAGAAMARLAAEVVVAIILSVVAWRLVVDGLSRANPVGARQ